MSSSRAGATEKLISTLGVEYTCDSGKSIEEVLKETERLLHMSNGEVIKPRPSPWLG